MANYRKAARRSARRHGIDPDIFARQINAESGFNPTARSPAGALGIAQIMPDTARGWGVDPMNPIAALDAAAQNMARYIRDYGGWENALRAYNAGPGAIEASRGYSETNAYVSKILRGQNPNPGNPSAFNRLMSKTMQVEDPEAFKRVVLANYLVRNNPDSLLLRLGVVSPNEPTTRTVDAATHRRTPAIASSRGGAGAPGTLHELFYDPLGGWDEGKSIGAIGGHSDHVHFAAGSHKEADALGRLAQKMGLQVRELEPFDKVDPVHTDKSFHYEGLAGDASGSPAAMRRFTNRLRKMYGLS